MSIETSGKRAARNDWSCRHLVAAVARRPARQISGPDRPPSGWPAGLLLRARSMRRETFRPACLSVSASSTLLLLLLLLLVVAPLGWPPIRLGSGDDRSCYFVGQPPLIKMLPPLGRTSAAATTRRQQKLDQQQIARVASNDNNNNNKLSRPKPRSMCVACRGQPATLGVGSPLDLVLAGKQKLATHLNCSCWSGSQSGLQLACSAATLLAAPVATPSSGGPKQRQNTPVAQRCKANDIYNSTDGRCGRQTAPYSGRLTSIRRHLLRVQVLRSQNQQVACCRWGKGLWINFKS